MFLKGPRRLARPFEFDQQRPSTRDPKLPVWIAVVAPWIQLDVGDAELSLNLAARLGLNA